MKRILLLLFVIVFPSCVLFSQVIIESQRSEGGLSWELFGNATHYNQSIYQIILIDWRDGWPAEFSVYDTAVYGAIPDLGVTRIAALRKCDINGNTIFWKPIVYLDSTENGSRYVCPVGRFCPLLTYVPGTPPYLYLQTQAPDDYNQTSAENPYFRNRVYKMDTLGNIISYKKYGGRASTWMPFLGDELGSKSCVAMSDGGLIFSTEMHAREYETSTTYGPYQNSWICRIDSAGKVLWETTIGDYHSRVFPNDMVQVSEDMLMVCGYHDQRLYRGGSFNAPVHNVSSFLDWDGYIALLNINTGEIISTKSYGGSRPDYLYNISKLGDNKGYVLSGVSESNDGDLSARPGSNGESSDAWLMYLDNNLNVVWSHAFGGAGKNDQVNDVFSAPDDGFMCFGYTNSDDVDCAGNPPIYHHTPTDIWVLHLDSGGQLLSQRSLSSTYIKQEALGHSAAVQIDKYKYLLHVGINTEGSPTPPGYMWVPGDWFIPMNDSVPWNETNLWVATVVDTSYYEGVSETYQIADDKLSVFPNPCNTSLLHIDLPESFSHFGVQLRFIDMLGKTVLQHTVLHYKPTIDVSNLPQGTYIVEASNGILHYSSKLIISSAIAQ